MIHWSELIDMGYCLVDMNTENLLVKIDTFNETEVNGIVAKKTDRGDMHGYNKGDEINVPVGLIIRVIEDI